MHNRLTGWIDDIHWLLDRDKQVKTLIKMQHFRKSQLLFDNYWINKDTCSIVSQNEEFLTPNSARTQLVLVHSDLSWQTFTFCNTSTPVQLKVRTEKLLWIGHLQESMWNTIFFYTRAATLMIKISNKFIIYLQ